MPLTINWSTLLPTLISGAIASAINGVAMFLSVRYVSKVVDKFDGHDNNNKKKIDSKQ